MSGDVQYPLNNIPWISITCPLYRNSENDKVLKVN